MPKTLGFLLKVYTSMMNAQRIKGIAYLRSWRIDATEGTITNHADILPENSSVGELTKMNGRLAWRTDPVLCVSKEEARFVRYEVKD
ncbi:unnamed protein product [Lathyrus sativus]|nr:unnamed protein product [Lathyrus sativus]